NVAATAPENPGALSLTLSPQELAAIEAVFPHDAAAGPRYWPEIMSTLNR
ncbi:TPA: aldo/keto reductase, partial [Salmonella enterica]|nr:aldo/keto reductase [Salmonella enterica]